MTSEEFNTLLTAFRKETEDLTVSLVKDMFQIQYGEISITAGETKTVSLSDPVYASASDYQVVVFEATDINGVNIIDAITITDQGTNYFEVHSPRAGTIRWQTIRKTPKINFWT
jgi:hypothetical protein